MLAAMPGCPYNVLISEQGRLRRQRLKSLPVTVQITGRTSLRAGVHKKCVARMSQGFRCLLTVTE